MSAMKDHLHDRLEYLRGEISAERISYGDLAELQGYGAEGLIPEDDVQLREWAGVPEFPEMHEYMVTLKFGTEATSPAAAADEFWDYVRNQKDVTVTVTDLKTDKETEVGK